MNQARGKPLLDRLHGGKGGGGTSLRPEGRTVLRKTAEIASTFSSKA
jgi:molybdate transport repressor ModE-like protein